MKALQVLKMTILFTVFLFTSCKNNDDDSQEKDINQQAQINFDAGVALARKYEFEDALPYLLKSVDQFEMARNFKMQTKALLQISLAYHDFGNYDKGIEYAYLAKKVLDEHPQQTNKNYYWYVYNDAGISYDDSKRPQQAIEEHFKALPFAADASDSSYSYNNLGNTYKKLNQLDKAEKYFMLSLQNSNDFSDDYHFATLHSNIMDIERLKKNYVLATKHLDSAFHYAIKSRSPEKLLDIHYYSYQLKNETGDYHAAVNELNNYVSLKDSLFTSEKNDAVLRYQTKYETEKKEKIIIEEKLVSKQKNIWLVVLGGSIIIGLVVFRNFRTKTRHKQQQLTLENQLLQEQAQSQIQQQRLEISRDLHDSLGAQLTFMNSVLDSIKSSASKLDEKTNSKINTLSDFSENSVSELKSVLWVLNSNEILIQDLKSKLLNFIKNAGEAKEDLRFSFNFDVKDNFRLNSKQAINLFRVSQEIINNAMKYAQASELNIGVQQSENVLRLQIADNGIGFDLAKEKNKSFGLTNIQKRINEINGSVTIETIPQKGTSFNIEIQLSV